MIPVTQELARTGDVVVVDSATAHDRQVYGIRAGDCGTIHSLGWIGCVVEFRPGVRVSMLYMQLAYPEPASGFSIPHEDD